VLKRYKKFISEYSGKVYLDQSLARYCVFKVGGKADLLVKVKTSESLIEILKLVRNLEIPYFILAGGSNIVFDDKGFRGLIIHYLADDIVVDKNKKTAVVAGGYKLSELVRTLAKENVGGIDFLANIPGSLGGAIVGNAGCYGKSISGVLASVTVFNIKTQKVSVILPSKIGFKYRDSVFKTAPHLVVLNAKLRLAKDSGQQILMRIAEEKALRWVKHPHQPSAGSFFKNPKDTPAWKLIEDAGMKGKSIGGAMVSTKHANFIINFKKATAKDILKLTTLVKKKVALKTKVKLESEVRFVRYDGKVTTY